MRTRGTRGRGRYNRLDAFATVDALGRPGGIGAAGRLLFLEAGDDGGVRVVRPPGHGLHGDSAAAVSGAGDAQRAVPVVGSVDLGRAVAGGADAAGAAVSAADSGAVAAAQGRVFAGGGIERVLGVLARAGGAGVLRAVPGVGAEPDGVGAGGHRVRLRRVSGEGGVGGGGGGGGWGGGGFWERGGGWPCWGGRFSRR